MAGGSEQPLTYCRELVRKQDYDSFLASYFYPRATQDTFFALKAFNASMGLLELLCGTLPQTISLLGGVSVRS